MISALFERYTETQDANKELPLQQPAHPCLLPYHPIQHLVIFYFVLYMLLLIMNQIIGNS